ncbi:hypothetical protein FPOAC1_009619 [Fusarium poae]|uniref:hypothetical protein n=1 Tax=Fusarium poae TaxID=36050 RepID=UPI001CE830B8|nr:hypothetical protein FPOAC1_009619 [Fusarium poae]KAG8670214.1 hypothetical protein FPOAC1_009619 [Fusarium poae]
MTDAQTTYYHARFGSCNAYQYRRYGSAFAMGLVQVLVGSWGSDHELSHNYPEAPPHQVVLNIISLLSNVNPSGTLALYTTAFFDPGSRLDAEYL